MITSLINDYFMRNKFDIDSHFAGQKLEMCLFLIVWVKYFFQVVTN